MAAVKQQKPRAKAAIDQPPADKATTEDEVPLVSSEDAPLDPATSTRRYWRDPHSGTQREIWRPGDGDGDIEHDHFERKGPAAPLDKRWRLYQLSPGTFKARINEPPSNVILDDRAVHEILQSNIPRAQLSKRWSHDFSGQANVRHRRSHRGRPAYKTKNNDETGSSESEKFHAFRPSAKVQPYYFTGEKDFTPVFYGALPEPAVVESPPEDPTSSPPKPKHHNQYTAPELLVRNGAQSASQTKGKYRARVNTFLRRSPSPPWVKDRKKLFGGVGIGRGPVGGAEGNLAPTAGFGFSFGSAPAPAPAEQGESMWVAQDEDADQQGRGGGDDDAVLLSMFDDAEGDTPARRADGKRGRRPENPLKRPASSSSFFSSRPKVPREMGYIERLAAGLSREEAQALTSSSEPNAAMARPLDSTALQERVDELEQQLEAANSLISEREQEIEGLRGQLDELQMQTVMERSMEGE
ncbi:hypothetical protein Q7P37_007759 [Cladosporium fusiforme]